MTRWIALTFIVIAQASRDYLRRIGSVPVGPVREDVHTRSPPQAYKPSPNIKAHSSQQKNYPTADEMRNVNVRKAVAEWPPGQTTSTTSRSIGMLNKNFPPIATTTSTLTTRQRTTGRRENLATNESKNLTLRAVESKNITRSSNVTRSTTRSTHSNTTVALNSTSVIFSTQPVNLTTSQFASFTSTLNNNTSTGFANVTSSNYTANGTDTAISTTVLPMVYNMTEALRTETTILETTTSEVIEALDIDRILEEAAEEAVPAFEVETTVFPLTTEFLVTTGLSETRIAEELTDVLLTTEEPVNLETVTPYLHISEREQQDQDGYHQNEQVYDDHKNEMESDVIDHHEAQEIASQEVEEEQTQREEELVESMKQEPLVTDHVEDPIPHVSPPPTVTPLTTLDTKAKNDLMRQREVQRHQAINQEYLYRKNRQKLESQGSRNIDKIKEEVEEETPPPQFELYPVDQKEREIANEKLDLQEKESQAKDQDLINNILGVDNLVCSVINRHE